MHPDDGRREKAKLPPRTCPMSVNKKRTFSKEFKVEAVKLITEQGYRVKQASPNLGVCETVLVPQRLKRRWEHIDVLKRNAVVS